MGKQVIRQMPNLLAKHKGIAVALVLFALSAGMLFFAGERLNNMITEWFTTMNFGEPEAFFGILIIAVILSTVGYYWIKK